MTTHATTDVYAMSLPHARPVPARIVLPGHPDLPARVEVVRYARSSRIVRTLARCVGWTGATVATFLVTMFDPFLTSIPLIVGAVSVYRSWKGRFRVCAFEGHCPRCRTEMALKPGTPVSVPHPMVCYTCHHEPELVFG